MTRTTWLAASVAAAALMGAGPGAAQDAAQTMEEIEAAAAEEGMLTTIALPHDWCNYGAMIEGFKARYP